MIKRFQRPFKLYNKFSHVFLINLNSVFLQIFYIFTNISYMNNFTKLKIRKREFRLYIVLEEEQTMKRDYSDRFLNYLEKKSGTYFLLLKVLLIR